LAFIYSLKVKLATRVLVALGVVAAPWELGARLCELVAGRVVGCTGKALLGAEVAEDARHTGRVLVEVSTGAFGTRQRKWRVGV
jgi:hypothetical protein